MFEIRLTDEAIEDMRALRAAFRNRVLEGIDLQLTHEPSQETRHRKRLRPNRLAEWEVRIGEFRVFYDVTEETKTVTIKAIGHKVGNRLYVGGKEYEL